MLHSLHQFFLGGFVFFNFNIHKYNLQRQLFSFGFRRCDTFSDDSGHDFTHSLAGEATVLDERQSRFQTLKQTNL